MIAFLLSFSVVAVPNEAATAQSAPVVRRVDPFETADPNCKLAKRVAEEIAERSRPSIPMTFCQDKEVAMVSLAGIKPSEMTAEWKAQKLKSWKATSCNGSALRLSKAGWRFVQHLTFNNGQKHKLTAAC